MGDRRPFARLAGSGRLPDGRRLTWTVADGSRGRRWRSTTVDADGRLVLALLVEVGLDGAIQKVEAAAAAGLLTLHPEARWFHGNVARDGSIEHTTLRRYDGAVLVGASPVAVAVVAAQLTDRVAVGASVDVVGVEIDDDLLVSGMAWRVERMGERAWRFTADVPGGATLEVELDEDGVPVLEDAASGPLERAEDHDR
jgi:hypothetical protein